MREDLVTPATARRLQRAGLLWEPQLGDWCAVLGGEHISEAQPGLWLVAAVALGSGLLGVMDAAGQWSMARVPRDDCIWLPSVGKLKMWLRAHGYRVATREAEPAALGTGARHLCRLTPPNAPGTFVDGEGSSEAEAVAETALHVLADASRPVAHGLGAAAIAPDEWISLPDAPTRKWSRVHDAPTHKL